MDQTPSPCISKLGESCQAPGASNVMAQPVMTEPPTTFRGRAVSWSTKSFRSRLMARNRIRAHSR